MYGAKKTSDGKAISANGMNPILTGLCVKDNKILSLEMAKDENGNENPKRAILTFEQSNGAKFQHSFWDSSESWGIDQINREMLHICNKIVSEEEYDSVVNNNGDNTFSGFINAIAEHIIPQAHDKLFNLKIVYKENKNNGKWYPNFPKFPNFIEPAGTETCTFSTNPKYDIYEMPAATAMPDTAPENSGEDFPQPSDTPSDEIVF